MRHLLACLLCFSVALTLPAQVSIGSCVPGEASALLDANNVSARLYNNGVFFWKDGEGNHYAVPKTDSIHAVFNMSLWFAGRDANGNVRFAGTETGPTEYWPGPIDAQSGQPVDPSDCSTFDRIWQVTDEDLRAFEQEGVLSDDLRDWPAHLGAPVLDGDGDPTNYDLAAGDRPVVYGEQTLWWVMNDLGNVKQSSESDPIGLEVQVTAFSARCIPSLPDTPTTAKINESISNTTYYQFRYVHKGQTPLTNTYTAYYADGDLGNWHDDFVGSDSTLGLGYFYNADEADTLRETYSDGAVLATERVAGYQKPPALGFLHMNPTADVQFERTRKLRTVFPWQPQTDRCTGSATCDSDWRFRMMEATWRDGTPLTLGKTGYNPGSRYQVSFIYPGDPVRQAYWTEENVDGHGQRNTPGDRRLVLASGPFDFNPGDTLTTTLAIIWSQSANRLASVAKLRFDAINARAALGNLSTLDTRQCPTVPLTDTTLPTEQPTGYLRLDSAYPNPLPAGTVARIQYEVPQTGAMSLVVYDVLGREVATLASGMQEAGVYTASVSTEGWAAGVYLYRLEAAGVSATRLLTVVR